MIQDIEPHRFDIAFRRDALPKDDDCVVVLRGEDMAFDADERPLRYEAYKRMLAGSEENALAYLFSLDDTSFFLALDAPPAMDGCRFLGGQAFRGYQPSWLSFALITAWHLALWYDRNRHCGRCSTSMRGKPDERALVCDACGLILYPAISPAVIVGVVNGDALLMTRYANRPYRGMALVAGFMEVGETLEDTVRREVMEEVGVRVKNIRYFKSQPWGFSSSVLVGFFADLDGSPEITLDRVELGEAVWIPRDEIAPRESDISLTSEMIEAFRAGVHPPA